VTFDELKGELGQPLPFFSDHAVRSDKAGQFWHWGELTKDFKEGGCGSYSQNNNIDFIVRPPAKALWKVVVTEDFLNIYLEFLKNIHPKIKENIEADPPNIETLELHCHTGHGYLNYTMFVFWRYLWSHPKAPRIAVYLHKNGFSFGEICFTLAAVKQLWHSGVYSSHVLEASTIIGKGVINKINNLYSLNCSSPYSLQEKLKDETATKKYKEQYAEYYHNRTTIPEPNCLIEISPFKEDSIAVFRNLDKIKEFIEAYQ
jgi:hypothetical protein